MKRGISIILPVWNEASIINDTIKSILSIPYDGEIEVIVVDGSLSGETINAITEKSVKRLISDKGRSRQMNKGASDAAGEVLLFLHADTLLPEGALEKVSSATGEEDVVGGAFDLAIESRRPIFRLIEKAATFRSRITGIPYGDQAIFIRKDFFDSIGGFRDIPLMEDVDLMRRIRKTGRRIHIIPDRVRTSPRRWEKEGVLRCTLRNWIIITLYLLGVPPEKLARFYR